MSAYYNENDPKAAAWLRELISQGHIAAGKVDERDIQDVLPTELAGYTQCHFFAGVGGWSYALRLAGWPDDKPVWTASCPCQPFSAAGERKGTADERHLWPAFYWLVEHQQLAPPTIFGEQVASEAGREWLAGVRTDLEAMGYAVGAADLCAAGVGAPQQRQRLYWLAHANLPNQHQRPSSGQQPLHQSMHGHTKAVAHPTSDRSQKGPAARGWQAGNIVTRNNERLGDSKITGPQRQRCIDRASNERSGRQPGSAMQTDCPQWNGPTQRINCTDGQRRISAEPRAFPLVTRVPARMVRLRGYGNAIVPQVAAEFIKTYQELEHR